MGGDSVTRNRENQEEDEGRKEAAVAWRGAGVRVGETERRQEKRMTKGEGEERQHCIFDMQSFKSAESRGGERGGGEEGQFGER